MAYKVFISHAFDHFELYDSIVSRLNRSGFDWIDCSVPRQRRFGADETLIPDDEMKKRLSEYIDSCEVVVAIAKPIASIRPYLRWEIEYAKLNGKPIIAVWRRQVDLKVSRFVMLHADHFVDTWNIVSIMRKIEEVVRETRRKSKQQTRRRQQIIPSREAFADDVEIVPLRGMLGDDLATKDELALGVGESIQSAEEYPHDVIDKPNTEMTVEQGTPIPIGAILQRPQSALEPSKGISPKDVILRDRSPTQNISGADLKKPWWWPFRRWRGAQT
jgi:MTH538 TIR-like domain (DUF1863)